VTPERWADVERILLAALEHEAEERAAFVAQACAHDAGLRHEVESLLSHDSEAPAFLSTPGAVLISNGLAGAALTGHRLGQYVLGDQLGAGGMGEVYRARDTRLNRDVAIKILPPAFMRDGERVARFTREAQTLAALNHPHVGAIYGLENFDEVPALVLELVEGPTLAERLQDGPPAIHESLAIATQISEALEAAHDQGIVHRDLKPANIKIAANGMVKLLDFGLAKGLGVDGIDPQSHPVAGVPLGQSRPGEVLGTVAYMSPEQAKGEPVDTRTDLFSLGAVIYEMVTGAPAFRGAESSIVADTVVHRTPPSPRDVNPSVPIAFEQIIGRLLMKDRNARYQTAAEVRRDLQQLRQTIDAGRWRASTRSNRLRTIAIAGTLVIAIGIGFWMWPREGTPQRSSRPDYSQITHFADSATSPALSPDGRLLTFIRGASTFEGLGQIYLKALPDAEPIQLTNDPVKKMGPVFSTDGSRIAYTTVGENFAWDTWVIDIADRKPRLWLANASGLAWIDERHILFSQIATGVHMNVVTADHHGQFGRPVYTPMTERGMAHRSHVSPDGKHVLIVEMDQGIWQRCRLVPLDGGSPGTSVGPDGQCTSAAWSPDGTWMFFSSNVNGSFHIWRQRFPNGASEQITGGPNEEEGVAVDPDGHSLLTSIGSRRSSMWLVDARGEREISSEGYAFVPGFPTTGMSQPFSADSRSLLYLVRRGAVRFTGAEERAGELWRTKLETGRSESLVPGFQVIGYDVSRDGKQLVFAALDDRGVSHLWLSRLDDRLVPRQLAPIQADSPRFGASGEIFCRGTERGSNYIYRLKDGRPPETTIARAVLFLLSVAPDGRWLMARVAATDPSSPQKTLAFPTSGGSPVPVCDTCEVDWTPNGTSLIVRLSGAGQRASGRTYVIALQPGTTRPVLPPQGIRSEADLLALPISQTLEGFVYPSDNRAVSAVVRRTIVRNIYRVRLP
jgi:eukaryotic-like serine/threonine-protein kinase